MAAPPSVTVKNMTATFVMNKKISDSSIPTLKLQKIPWIVQQAAYYSTITVKLKQYKDDAGVVHLDQEQLSTGTVQHEPRVLSGETLEREVQFWGKVKGSTQFKKLDAITEDDFLKEGWLVEDDGELIETSAQSLSDTWTTTQVWGFAEVQGERRHVRRIVTKKEDKVERIRLVYDWQE